MLNLVDFLHCTLQSFGMVLKLLGLAALWGLVSALFIRQFVDLIIIPLIDTLRFTIFGIETKAFVTRIRYQHVSKGDDDCASRGHILYKLFITRPQR